MLSDLVPLLTSKDSKPIWTWSYFAIACFCHCAGTRIQTGRYCAVCISPLPLNCSANEDPNERRCSLVKEQPNHANCIFSRCLCVLIIDWADETTFVWLERRASPHISSFSSLTLCCKSGWMLKYINHTIWSCPVSPAKQMSNGPSCLCSFSLDCIRFSKLPLWIHDCSLHNVFDLTTDH